MMVLVCYDISTKDASGEQRLQKVAKKCLNYGLRVQNSVFECNIEPSEWEQLKHELLKIYNAEEDSLRFYYLGSNWQRRVEHYGSKKIPDIEEPMIL